MKTATIAVLLTVLISGVAVAREDWAAGPVKHLMTSEEKAQWAEAKTKEAQKAFIDLFWAKRDPSIGTPENELKLAFDKRVELADQHFTTKRTRGAMTDRGRVMILLGSPFDVGTKGPSAAAAKAQVLNDPDEWDGSVASTRAEPALMTWTYAQDKKPPFIKRPEFVIMFADEHGDGQWQLAKTEMVDPEAILQEAIRGYIVTPNPTVAGAPAAAPSAPVASFRTVALKSATDQFRSEGKTSEGPGLLTWGQFVTPDGETFVPVQMFVPKGGGIEAGRALTFFGVVENAEGQVVAVHEDEVQLADSRSDAYVDKSLKLQPGSYKGTFGLAEQGKVLTMVTTDLKVDQLDPLEPAISDMIISNNAFPLEKAQKITDPFAFGGLKVVPKADGRFSTADDIWYFYELRNPGLSETGEPKLQAKIDITGKTAEDKPVKMNFPMQEFPAIPLKGVQNHFGLALTFPLKDFKPGKYTVKIKVIDMVLKKSYESEKQFEVKS